MATGMSIGAWVSRRLREAAEAATPSFPQVPSEGPPMTQEQDNRPSEAVDARLRAEMRSLGYQVVLGNDTDFGSIWHMTAPHVPDTIYLAISENEGWEKASEHWHSHAVAASLSNITPSPAPTSDEAAVEAADPEWHRIDIHRRLRDGPQNRAAMTGRMAEYVAQEVRAAITAYKLACPVEGLDRELREAATALLQDIAAHPEKSRHLSGRKIMALSDALANWTAGGGDGQR